GHGERSTLIVTGDLERRGISCNVHDQTVLESAIASGTVVQIGLARSVQEEVGRASNDNDVLAAAVDCLDPAFSIILGQGWSLHGILLDVKHSPNGQIVGRVLARIEDLARGAAADFRINNPEAVVHVEIAEDLWERLVAAGDYAIVVAREVRELELRVFL